jgi:hypothetical protein
MLDSRHDLHDLTGILWKSTMDHAAETNLQTDSTTDRAVSTSQPWVAPGTLKEVWKAEGNVYDYRDLRASRPGDLKVSISGPRQFRGV